MVLDIQIFLVLGKPSILSAHSVIVAKTDLGRFATLACDRCRMLFLEEGPRISFLLVFSYWWLSKQHLQTECSFSHDDALGEQTRLKIENVQKLCGQSTFEHFAFEDVSKGFMG